MSSTKKALKLIIGNFFVLVLILATCDLLATAILFTRDSVKQYLWARRSNPGVALDRHELIEFEKEQLRAGGIDESQWSPYVYWRRAPMSGRYVNIDADGLRRTWNPAGLPARPIRVFVFGGSTVWGTGSRDDYTIPSQLSKILAKQFGPKVEVVNFGEGGYVNTQELIAFIKELERGNVPQIAIFYDGFNDVFSAFQNGEAGIPQNEINRVREFSLTKSGPKFYKEFVMRSNLYLLFSDGVGYVRHITNHEHYSRAFESRVSNPSNQALIADLLQIYGNNTRMLHAIGGAYDVRVFSFWQPSVYTKPELTSSEKAAEDWDPVLKDFYRQTSQAFDSSPVAKMDSFYNLSGIFNGHPEMIFEDYVHVSERGNEIIANQIASEISGAVTQLLHEQPPQQNP
jgi:hypothetical protein